MEYLKLFDTHSEYETYMNGGGGKAQRKSLYIRG